MLHTSGPLLVVAACSSSWDSDTALEVYTHFIVEPVALLERVRDVGVVLLVPLELRAIGRLGIDGQGLAGQLRRRSAPDR